MDNKDGRVPMSIQDNKVMLFFWVFLKAIQQCKFITTISKGTMTIKIESSIKQTAMVLDLNAIRNVKQIVLLK